MKKGKIEISLVAILSIIACIGIVFVISTYKNTNKNTEIAVYQAKEERATATTSTVVETWNISATEQDNVTATLYKDGTLEITGNGNMKDWSFGFGDDAPWYSKRNAIKAVQIGENVTSIGSYGRRRDDGNCTGNTA